MKTKLFEDEGVSKYTECVSSYGHDVFHWGYIQLVSGLVKERTGLLYQGRARQVATSSCYCCQKWQEIRPKTERASLKTSVENIYNSPAVKLDGTGNQIVGLAERQKTGSDQ